jgi:hypothetical protein
MISGSHAGEYDDDCLWDGLDTGYSKHHEASVSFYENIRRNIPEDRHINVLANYPEGSTMPMPKRHWAQSGDRSIHFPSSETVFLTVI